MELQIARQIIDTLAQGIHPVTGEAMPEDSPYNAPPVIRALHTVSCSLDEPAGALRAPLAHTVPGLSGHASGAIVRMSRFMDAMKVAGIEQNIVDAFSTMCTTIEELAADREDAKNEKPTRWDAKYPEVMEEHEGNEDRSLSTVDRDFIVAGQVPGESAIDEHLRDSHGGDLMTGTPSLHLTINGNATYMTWAEAYALGRGLIELADVSHYG